MSRYKHVENDTANAKKILLDTLGVLLYQYTHALYRCDTHRWNMTMITAIVTLWLSALATGMLMMGSSDHRPA